MKNFRWTICGLLFAATTINYIDRAVLGVLEPELKKVIQWTDTEYGDINAAFSFAYALGFLIVGRFIDRVGVRFGYAASLVFWSLAAAAHALAATPLGFGIARFLLGLGEAGNFPAAVKTTAEWFPQRERAFVTGIAGLLWVIFWLPIYREPENHPRVTPAELAHIRSDGDENNTRVPWLPLLSHRQTWAFAMGKFLTDPVWWFYLFWSGKFFAERFGVSIKTIGAPLITIYVLADIGSVAGGWFSSFLLKRGWTANAARKLTMLLCALCVLPVAYAPVTDNLWTAVLLISLAAAAHQGFSANLFTLTSDLFPRRAVGSVVGIGGMAGAIGGILMQSASGRIKEATGSYLIMFIIAGIVYFLGLAAVHVLAPKLKRAEIG